MSASAAQQLHGEIESPRPLRARGGKISIRGWCLSAGLTDAPAVRLCTEAGILPVTTRTERDDVPRFRAEQPARLACGFEIEGRLPAGVYSARFEAQMPDGEWRVFKELSLAVERAPLSAVLDEPVAGGILRDRVRVGGWALQPDEPIAELYIRYGHREVPCILGGPRRDVPGLFPGVAHASRAGFESKEPLVAGHGPVRLRGRLASGRTVHAPTNLTFSISTDENHRPELDLTAERAVLPAGRRPPPTLPAQAKHPLNILFILHGDFTSNSTLQVCALANELAAAGHDCTLAVPRDRTTFAYQQAPRFRPLLHAEAAALGGGFRNGKGPDIIHAWTTREPVRLACAAVRQKHGGRLVVQLEDNEQEILAQAVRRTWEELRTLPDSELTRLVPSEYSHPVHSGEFLAAADGVTVIIDTLRRFVPVGRPCATVWPAADSRYFYPRPVPSRFRECLRLDPATAVLFYHGNVHAANAGEMRALYEAVRELNRTGHPTCLIRAGSDQVDFLGSLAREIQPWVLSLGPIHTHRHLPSLMALADIFVQPGSADPFNDFRFPSKLPEFFSIGRPVVLPRTNLGAQLRHGTDAYVLENADAAGIARAVVELRQDRSLYDRLCRGAVTYAEGHFSWGRSAETLAKFYATLTA